MGSVDVFGGEQAEVAIAARVDSLREQIRDELL
jgi:hypothetical protein